MYPLTSTRYTAHLAPVLARAPQPAQARVDPNVRAQSLLLAPGAEHELGFGSDPSVIVKYHILAEKRGETGIISSSVTDQRNFRIDVTNQHERPIDIVLIDQMPVSLNDEISVELLGPAAPTKKNFEDKRGLLAWQFPLEGAQKRSISFGYTIAWPTDKKIIYRHRQ